MFDPNDAMSLGQKGGIVVTPATGELFGRWGILHAVTDCTFSELNCDSTLQDELGDLQAATIKAGDRVFAPFNHIIMASGTCILYNR